MRDHFSQVGDVTYAGVMSDRNTGKSRGCGKVAFSSEDAMNAAIDRFNNSDFDGRTISVRAFV